MHWSARFVKITFILFLLQPASVFAQDDFENATVIEIGSNVYGTAHPEGEYYRVWFDGPGYEFNVHVSGYSGLLSIFDSNKVELTKIFYHEEAKFGIITDRGWYYIRISSEPFHRTFVLNVTANSPNPNKFKVGSLNIVPDKAYEYEDIAFFFNVENEGQLKDNISAELIIDDETVDIQDVEINGNEIKELRFNVVANGEGIHNAIARVSPIWSTYTNEVQASYLVMHSTSSKFEISNLIIDPVVPNIGQSVNISVDVTNIGDLEGTDEVKLFIDNQLEKSENVNLLAGEKKKVSFTIIKNYAGLYNVKINNLSGIFEVVSPGSTPTYINLSTLTMSNQISDFNTASTSLEIAPGWEIDYKSTRIIAMMDRNGKVHVDFVGTITNYAGRDVPVVKVDVKILNDGVVPSQPEGGSTSLELFATKAVYSIADFKNGQTKDWVIRTEITDPENIKKIDYQVKVFIMDNGNNYSLIYSTDKTIDIILADSDGDGLDDYKESKIGTDINKKDTDDDGKSDFEEFNSGTNPLVYDTPITSNKESDSIPGFSPISFVLALCMIFFIKYLYKK